MAAGREGAGRAEEGLFGPLDEPRKEAKKPQVRKARAKVEPVSKAPRPGNYANVAVNRPLRCEFTYGIPDELLERARPGVRVAVPFGSRREVGVVVGLADAARIPEKRLKYLSAVLDEEPVVDAELLALTRWMSQYYLCSWGEALAAVLPAPLKRERGLRRVRVISAAEGVGREELEGLEKRSPQQFRLLRTLLDIDGHIEVRELERRLNLSSAPANALADKGLAKIERVEAELDTLDKVAGGRPRHDTLSDEQEAAVQSIGGRILEGGYRTYLLQGVTGSGKTEVYLRVIEQALERGKGAIVLVPEISLTPQTVGWFRSRFDGVAVLHSRMTDAQRLEMWMRVKRGQARVVVGARSAIFAPVSDLGVVVVDEEHEPSFKQSNSPRYHARDVAVVRARNAGAVCVLGSATPALESWHNAALGRYEHVRLQNRVAGGELPPIEVVDMRTEKPVRGEPLLFSKRMKNLLCEVYERKEQSILFLNRRGFSPVLWCHACQKTVTCKNCDVTLTFHRRIGRAVCHSCCEETEPPKTCPTCTAPAVRYLGLGSERVEDALKALLPDASVRRMDSDTMLRREDYEETLDAFGAGEIDVLVGTQMIAKGLDFPRVTLVGIVSADSSLHLPDFRAAERTFQLLSQVAGRAGRGELRGRIIVQTHTPEHDAIRTAARHDYEGFVKIENQLRSELGYPPHGRLIRVVFEDTDDQRASTAAAALGGELTRAAGEYGLVVLGPAPAPIAQLRGRFRHHLLLKAPSEGTAFAHARSVLMQHAETHRTNPRMSIDVDPVGMM